MVEYKKSYEIKNQAKDTLEGRYRGAMLIIFLSGAISWMVRMSISIVGGNMAGSIYMTTRSETGVLAVSVFFEAILILASVILGVMNAGITLYFLKLACGQPLALGDLFYGYKSDSKKTLAIAGAMVLCQVICLGPYQHFVQRFLDGWEIQSLLYALIALAVGLCAYIPLSLGISMSFYLMFDFPQKSGKEILLLCWRIMKGKRLRLFCLELSFLPLMALCILSFGIGYLWLRPYMQMTYTFFFLDMMNPKSKVE